MIYNILVVEDEKEIAEAIKLYLKNQGYEVILAENGKIGLEILEEQSIQLVISDVMMPIMDGISFVIKLREKYHIPVIMLSSKSEETDQIMALNIGADDYVTKPFKPMELLARVNSNIRRFARYENMNAEKQEEDFLTCGGIELNLLTKELNVNGKAVRLTSIELKIFTLLMKNQGRIFSSEEIYERVWNEKAVNTETIMVHIRNIREKIEVNPKNPQYLKVVWGIGYKIEKQ